MRLELPFPVSVNRIWRSRSNGKGVFRSARYTAWQKQADIKMLQQQAAKTIGNPVDGYFTYHIVLDQSQRVWRGTPRDGDNFTKVVLDYLQSRELIENDSFADSGTWSWGPVDGCVVTVHRSLIQRAA